MRCPHCQVTVHEEWHRQLLTKDGETSHGIYWMKCPACKQTVIRHAAGKPTFVSGVGGGGPQSFYSMTEVRFNRIVYPFGGSRPVPPSVPGHLAKDYTEAAAVISLSPTASAALSRRCLQNTIRDATQIVKPKLFDEIEETIDQRLVPSWLADQLHELRKIGNFAAHPTKDTNTGEILDVEPGEAEWTLDILEGLFDHFYVGPAKAAMRSAALKQKLNPPPTA